MPLVKRPHGRRERHQVLAELTFPAQAYKARQAIFPLREELARKDSLFRQDAAKIRAGMARGMLSTRQADELYFMALDAAIKRQRKVA